MYNPLSNNEGSALLISLSLMLMLSLIAIAAVQKSNTDIDLAFNNIHSEKAFYIADAGAKRAYMEIVNDPTWRAGYSDIQFGGGTYTVAITDSSTNAALCDTILITATGENFNSMSTIEITVAPGIINPFKYALFADDDVDIRNSMRTDSYNSDSGSYLATHLDSLGDVGSNGTIGVKNGAYIGGDVATSLAGGATVNPGATVTGTVSNDAPEQTLEPISAGEFNDAQSSNAAPAGLIGSYSLSGDDLISSGNLVLEGGTYYFTSIILKNSATLSIMPGEKVTIYVEGDIELKNSGGINTSGAPSDLIFYTSGDIVLKNSSDLHGVFYSPEGSADLRNSADFYGSIVANDIVAHNSANYHYDRNLGNITREGSGDIELIAWREM